MTFRALRIIPCGELPSVDVFVAVLAMRRRGPEVDIHQLGFKVRRLVTIDASCRPMRPQQGKFRLGVIEAG